MRTAPSVATITLLAALAACSGNEPTNANLGAAASALVNADIASVSAEAVGQDVEFMRGPGGNFALGFAAERGKFECGNAARDGLTATRSCVFKDAAGATQSAYDDQTTASVTESAAVSGTVTRGAVTMTIDRTNTFVVTGLAGNNTTATWNGTGSGTASRVRTAENGTTREYNMTYTTQRTDVVLPASTTGWPLSGTVTKRFTLTFVGGANDGKTITRDVVITFNGTSTPAATINGEAWELDLTTRGRRQRP
jgi:hypothetical protein